MKKIRLNVLGLSVSQTQTGAYALVLSEDDGGRRIPIIIGPVEAQAIAIQLEGLKPPRPLTHDLFRSVANAFEIVVREVLIHKLEEGIFFSEIVCVQQGNEMRIDSRTSDAVALALRFNCPIYTTDEIMSKAGIIIEPEASEEDPVVDMEPELKISSGDSLEEYSEFSVPELQELLNEAIESEDYERASQIRDEIDKRK
ncbi:hypothetical protein EYV94_11830 [Puteibacter caeruleilacunae]|nr:hypothetical protein EYV94_11830 [Puteibacter caeruleilacunae]